MWKNGRRFTGGTVVEEGFWFDPLVFGKRLRHYRRVRGLTLAQLGERVGKQASFLSMLEGGKREPRPGLVEQLAQALDVRSADLLRADPPDKRSRLEVALERAQTEPLYQRLHLPPLKASAALPDAALEHLVGLYAELQRACAPATPTIQEARRATVEQREEVRKRDNYFAEIEKVAAEALRAVGYPGSGAVAQRTLTDLATHFGFTHPAGARRAGFGPGGDRHARSNDLHPPARRAAHPRSPLGHPPDAGALRPGPPRPRGLPRLPPPAHRGQLLRRRRARPRAGRPHPAGGRQGRRRPLGGGPQGGLLRLLRDGRPPLLQPGHARPRPAGALRALRLPGHHLEGLRERRRPLPHRPRRSHRGRAPLPGVGHPPGLPQRGRLRRPLPAHRHPGRRVLVRHPCGGRPPAATTP